MSAEPERQHERLPPPSFMVVVSNFATQALIELGEIKNPITDKAQSSPERAKFTIDILQILRDKTQGNLTPEEQRFVDSALYELRMKYVRLVG